MEHDETSSVAGAGPNSNLGALTGYQIIKELATGRSADVYLPGKRTLNG